MTIVRWSETYETGIPRIDVQHRDLLQTINRLHECVHAGAGPEKILSTLTFLIEYAETHFREEETLMQKSDFPGLEEHRNEHQSFASKVIGFRAQLQTEGSNLHPADLILFIVGWFSAHIMETDMQMRDWVHPRIQHSA